MGIWLNVFVRQSKYVGMANIAQSVNVISPLMTTKEGLVKQTTWWPLLLFCKYMQGSTVACQVSGATYDGETVPVWLKGTRDVPWLDVSATVNEEGWVSVCVVNVHEGKDFEVDLKVGVAGEVQVYTVSGDNVWVTNMKGKEEVGIKESKWDGKGKFTFPKHSLTMMRWKS